MPKKRPGKYLPHRDRFTEKRYLPYVIAIGQAALAWNALHERLALLFCNVMGGGWVDRPFGVWFSAQYDRPRRAMLRAAVDTTTAKDQHQFPKLLNDVKWILNEADKLEDIRNNVIHAPLFSIRDSVEAKAMNLPLVWADTLFGNPRAKNIEDRVLLLEFRWLRDMALCLRDFTSLVEEAATDPKRPWPGRPSPPIRPQKRTPQTPQHRGLKK